MATVEQFDVDDAGRATLIAHWQVVDFRTGRPVAAEVARVTEPSADATDEARVAALSRASAALATVLAQAIQGLPAPMATSAAPARLSP